MQIAPDGHLPGVSPQIMQNAFLARISIRELDLFIRKGLSLTAVRDHAHYDEKYCSPVLFLPSVNHWSAPSLLQVFAIVN